VADDKKKPTDSKKQQAKPAAKPAKKPVDKVKFYREQRIRAEETGDQATVDKIYKKLGRKSHSVDADAVNKEALGAVGSMAIPGGLGLAGKFTGMFGKKVAGEAGEAAMKRLGSALKKPKVTATIEREKATGSGPKALSSGKPVPRQTTVRVNKKPSPKQPPVRDAEKESKFSPFVKTQRTKLANKRLKKKAA
jgi:hypothetical protein